MGSPIIVELAEIREADLENTALTTYTDNGIPNYSRTCRDKRSRSREHCPHHLHRQWDPQL